MSKKIVAEEKIYDEPSEAQDEGRKTAPWLTEKGEQELMRRYTEEEVLWLEGCTSDF